MIDMLTTIVPRSDQANFDDFLAGQTKTIKISSVSLKQGEQPVTLHYEGDNGKPYKPCLSMRRVLVHCWGDDGKQYAGRSLTLYGDPTVKFGGAAVGGIRISHMSNIDKTITMSLTASKANRKPFTVHPLVDDPRQSEARKKAEEGTFVFREYYKSLPAADKTALKPILTELEDTTKKADAAKLETTTQPTGE